jgi:hypothetical protein
MNVELIYDKDCPNVSVARAQLQRAFSATRIPPHWREWDRSAPNTPHHVRRYGSPTILVDGRDVAGMEPCDDQDSCRVYPDSGALQRVPNLESICAALTSSSPRAANSRWGSVLATVPGIGLAMLPTLACPACWPAYVGLLSSLGLSLLLDERYLMPLMLAALVLAIAALAFRAERRNGYGPACIGCLAALLVLVGKFPMQSDPLTFGGIGALTVASLWNIWPRKTSA